MLGVMYVIFYTSHMLTNITNIMLYSTGRQVIFSTTLRRRPRPSPPLSIIGDAFHSAYLTVDSSPLIFNVLHLLFIVKLSSLFAVLRTAKHLLSLLSLCLISLETLLGPNISLQSLLTRIDF